MWHVEEAVPSTGPPPGPSRGRLRAVAFLLGLAVAGSGVQHLRIVHRSPLTGAGVELAALAGAELDVVPAAVVAVDPDLRPDGGSGVKGTVTVRNQTIRTLQVTVRAVPRHGDLDGLLQAVVHAGREELFRGTLGGLRNGSGRGVSLSPGQSTVVDVELALPPSLTERYQGLAERVDLAFDSVPAEA